MPHEPSVRNATQHHAFEVDDSRFPLVVASFRRTPTDDERDVFRTAIERVLFRHEKHALIVNLTLAGGMNAIQRMKQAAWLRQHADLRKTWTVGAAFVTHSLLARGALTAISWLVPLPYPYYLAATLAEAESWTIACLHDVGLSVPATRGRAMG